MPNENNKKLAIVIPAYKNVFLKETLTAISLQSEKNFTLYIGDDCSPDNLSEVVSSFADDINIVYKRFEHNLGNTDLVAHWQRCINMVCDEEWVWLFSDDDVMDPDCVKNFYKELKSVDVSYLYHFNVTRIDQNNNTLLTETEYDRNLSSTSFIYKLINFEITSYVVEYIFNFAHFKRLGGFEKFDLAWGSDHATWLKLAFNGTITTIPGAKVKWRSSGYNITSITNNKALLERKINAELAFYKWLANFFLERSTPLPFSGFSATRWFLQGIIIYTNNHGFRQVPGWIQRVSSTPAGNVRKLSCYCCLPVYTILFLCRKLLKSP